MKKTFLAFYAFLAGGGLFSCTKMLEEVPADRLSQVNFYQTKEDLTLAVNSIYGQLRTNELYGQWFPAFQEGMTDYCISRGSQVAISEYQGLDGTNIGRTDNMWRGFYQVINNANILLDVTPRLSLPDADKNPVLGQARFLRALAYYHLVRNFGGVPVRLQPTTSPEQIGGKRASVEEVYKAITDDLTAAEGLLPTRLDNNTVGRATAWAAKALLADVYLTRENWAAARDKAQEVIESGVFSLVDVKVPDDFDKVFGADLAATSEEIFALKFARLNNFGWLWVSFLHPAQTPYYGLQGSRAHFTRPTLPLLRDWDDKDFRKDYNLYGEYINTVTRAVVKFSAAEPLCFRKYRDYVPIGQPSPGLPAGNDAPVLRYPEVLLIYAEAASQAAGGPTALALERLNTVRRRAYGYAPRTPSPVDLPLAGLTAASFRNLVLRERAYELMMEGKRWYDLKRLGTDRLKTIIREAKGREVATAHLLFPIPIQEIDNNPDIAPTDQNPGY